MFFKKPSHIFLGQAANALIGVLLITGFTIGIGRILENVRPARYFSMGALKPQPMDYLWKINIQHAPVDKNLIRYYVDYEENLLKVFPNLADAYGVLGYCYHYLGNDPKAREYFGKAINGDPDYFWYHYDLAILDINAHDERAAFGSLLSALQLKPQTSIKALAQSTALSSLLPSGSPLNDFVTHLEEGYNQALFLVKVLGPDFPKDRAEGLLKQLKLELYLL